MTADNRPPPFYCPACGKKHRADLSELQGRAGAVAKVPCSRCEIIMSLRLGDDGLPKCEMNEVLGGIMSQAEAKKPGLLVPLVAAAIMAAVVSFGVVSATKSEAPANATADPNVQALEQTIQELRAELTSLRTATTKHAEAANTATADAARQRADMEKTLSGLGTTMTALEGQQSQLSTTFVALQKETKDLNGRIEANYVNLRKVEKRLKALEAD